MVVVVVVVVVVVLMPRSQEPAADLGLGAGKATSLHRKRARALEVASSQACGVFPAVFPWQKQTRRETFQTIASSDFPSQGQRSIPLSAITLDR